MTPGSPTTASVSLPPSPPNYLLRLPLEVIYNSARFELTRALELSSSAVSSAAIAPVEGDCGEPCTGPTVAQGERLHACQEGAGQGRDGLGAGVRAAVREKGTEPRDPGGRSPNILGHGGKERKYENYAAPWVKIKGWGRGG